MGSITKHKETLTVVLALGFLLTSYLFPVRRILYTGTFEPHSFQETFFVLHLWFPLLFLVYVRFLHQIKNAYAWDPFLGPWVRLVALSIVIGAIAYLTINGIAGFWWTWITVGVHVCTVFLVMHLLEGKLARIEAMAVGIGLASMSAGLWEIVYQNFYFNAYNPVGTPTAHLALQIANISPLVFAGLFTMYLYRKYIVNWGALAFFWLAIGQLYLWNQMGFWVDIVYNWDSETWEYTSHVDKFQMAWYRSSKAMMALSAVGLFTPLRGIRLKTIYGYLIIIPWSGFFAATSGFLLFTWLKSLTAKEGKAPYYKTRSIHYDRRFDSATGGGHREDGDKYVSTSSEVSLEVLEKLNEGLGGAYERYAYSRVISQHMKDRGLKTVLEYDATYIAGIPGFNSCLLAREGYDVTITVNERDYEDAVHAWKLLGLDGPNVHILRDDGTLKLPSNSYDLVYNHLAFEHYPDPQVLLQEMRRLSKDVVLNLTLAPYNLGFITHWIAHKWQGKRWDHGIIRQTMVGAMKKAHREGGMKFIEHGAADVPPWMDTVDGQMKGSMTYLDGYPENVRRKWIWCSADPELATRRWIRWMWYAETAMPDWFKMLVGHHLYVSSTVKGS